MNRSFLCVDVCTWLADAFWDRIRDFIAVAFAGILFVFPFWDRSIFEIWKSATARYPFCSERLCLNSALWEHCVLLMSSLHPCLH